MSEPRNAEQAAPATGRRIVVGDRVAALTAGGDWIPRYALTAIVPGMDFPVVWVGRARRDQDPMPWPAEAVLSLEDGRNG